MPAPIFHVLDATTPTDLFPILRDLLIGKEEPQKILSLGHRSTASLAAAAGIDPSQIHFLHSMGWADPTGWRSLKRQIHRQKPAAVHAWGIPAAIAATQALSHNGTQSPSRAVYLADLPPKSHMRLLPMIHKGTITGFGKSAPPCHWFVTTTWLKRELHSNGIAADSVSLLRPPLPFVPEISAEKRNALYEELGLLPDDRHILILAGEGGTGGFLAAPGIDPLRHGGRGGPRHDLGLWSAAILQQIFPRIRVLVREDPRHRPDAGFDRLFNHLPDDQIAVPVPAEISWIDLLQISDVLLATPDGPFSGGCMLAAFAAGVPVVGTPVESVREYISPGVTGILAASTKPRDIAAAGESLLAGTPEFRDHLTRQAREEAATRWPAAATSAPPIIPQVPASPEASLVAPR